MASTCNPTRIAAKGIVTAGAVILVECHAIPYRGYRFPEEIISQCVWLYFNFAVSLREVELMMAYRGIQLSYETIRRWCDTFGASYAAQLKRKRPKLGDKWFLDEVFLKINGVQHYLWRALSRRRGVILVECHAIHITVTDFRKRSFPNACGCTLTLP